MTPSMIRKAIVAAVGAGVTAALGIVPPDTATWQILTVAAALLTTASVYLVPNEPMPGSTVTGEPQADAL